MLKPILLLLAVFLLALLSHSLPVGGPGPRPTSNKRPSPSRRPSPRPSQRPTIDPAHRPTGRFSVKITSLLVERSSEELETCADPHLYAVYARVVPGVRGSTRTIMTGPVDFGPNRCSRTLISDQGPAAEISDSISVSQDVISVYIMVAIDKDLGDIAIADPVIEEYRKKVEAEFKQLESRAVRAGIGEFFLKNPGEVEKTIKLPALSEIPKAKAQRGQRPPSHLSDIDFRHDHIGTRALWLISVPNSAGLPFCNNRFKNPVCELRDMKTNMVIREEGVVNGNVWRFGYEVDEF